MKIMSRVLAVLGGLMLSLVSVVGAANADSSDYYVDQAVATLGNSNVYIGGGTISPAEISGAIDDGSLGVVVLPSDSVGTTLSSADIARQILASTNGKYETILVYQEGGRPGFTSSKIDNVELSTAAYAPFNDGGTLQENIIDSINAVEGIGTSTSPSGHSVADGLSPVGVMVIVVFALVIAGLIVAYRMERNIDRPKRLDVSSKIVEDVPTQLARLLKDLQDVAKRHSSLNDDRISLNINKIVGNVQELFIRIRKKGTNGQVGVAEVEYIDKLTKLNSALGEDYYLDIVKNKDLWDDADDRIDAVESAVSAVEYQLVENIRQVNASKDLEFQVALDSLVGSMDAPNIKSIYNTNKSNTDKKERNK